MCILPFTRNAVGPVDYTPGGFSDNTYPHLSTYGFELATTLILESGVLHLADTPDRIIELPSYAIDFLREIPVVWDDTRYLTGYPGEEVVLARKSGTRWFLAGVNGENESKDISIDLSNLGTIPANITLIEDGEGARDLQTRGLEPGEGAMSLYLQAYGGFVAYWDEP
jgi:hypothetical protein